MKQLRIIKHLQPLFTAKICFIFIITIFYSEQQVISNEIHVANNKLNYNTITEPGYKPDDLDDNKKVKPANKDSLVQFSGRVTNQYGIPLEYTHIIDINLNKGTVTDDKGLFTLVSKLGDTIYVSSIGYQTKITNIPDTLIENSYIVDITLKTDTVRIKEVRVFPWKTYEEFKNAFLALELDESDYDRAKKNVALIYTQILFDDTPIPTQTFKYVMQEQYERLFIQGQYPTTRLFDPRAWAEFIDALENGEIKLGDQTKN